MKTEMVKKVVTGGVVLLSTLLLSARVSTDAKTTDKQPIRVSQVAKTPVHHSKVSAKATATQPIVASTAVSSVEPTSSSNSVESSTDAVSPVTNASVSAPVSRTKNAAVAVSDVSAQPSQQPVVTAAKPTDTSTATNAAQPVNPALTAFRNQLGVSDTDANMQYMVTPNTDGNVQIDVRTQAPDPEVSNLVGVYTYNPSTQAITAVDPITGNQVVVQK
ncbi:hypothetical protein [Furfurilactobacillus siliginis]|uniref:PepSY domain-containing protein n=1 Tax=Furfurilactobacillus siliginis TaxID=348151 RepID=A0A0R2LA21_9LACO|nr:hypothetical protein [Furfurilactobacillus siliginis]KRN95978.1 hypothetical protein IV55_GL001649 [Furfurilactobacillus siliginis]GEK29168.1 hypothetical protein LSI01_14790 [Furfurilactobacillus siliginis]